LGAIVDSPATALAMPREGAARLRESIGLSHARKRAENSLRRKRLTGRKWLQLSLELIEQTSLDVFVAERFDECRAVSLVDFPLPVHALEIAVAVYMRGGGQANVAIFVSLFANAEMLDVNAALG